MALDREALAADVSRARERCIRVAAHAGERQREIAAGGIEQQHVVPRGRAGMHDRRQGLDVERDRRERVLGGGGAVGQHHRDRLADIADLVVRDHRLLEGLEGGRGFLPQRNGRDRGADIGGGDDGMHARPRQCRARIDRADASMRDRAAQDHRVQKMFAHEVVDELAAAAQKAQILDAFDRAADEGVGRAPPVHVRSRSSLVD